ncbi:protein EVI2A [Anolis sagrei]|uniref:protein EVI2A n=1 Tax=Anolis sagrei TaxID=38937 RepID=UPI003522ADB8
MAKFHIYLVFLCGIILPLCLQIGVAAMETPLTTSPSVLTTQTPTSPSSTDPSTTVISQDLLTTQETTTYTTQVTTFLPTSSVQTTMLPTQSSSPETSTSPPLASTLPPDVPTSSYSVTGPGQESVTLSENPTKAELCEENNKRLMLICLIIIGLLVFLCVCLLLVVVVMAIKLSHVKRSQASRRLPRTNGDFLSASSLWPIGLETLQRMNTETTETSLPPQGPREERTSGQEKAGEEASRKLASEISIRQKNKEMSPKETTAKPRNSSITKIEI